ncbi:hypothetical protein [Porphyromonas sp. oral taxon 275]|uniref:hypothetical protein n=1 Tax=Porphyromonas sp. oral taxon 275 TaxID=712435 RepID=UPI001BA8AA53|nr:hypothetical protein [Porphyromonas sp. oral taxon 275]QUB43417.1 hypothetical protein J4862_01975 [Porphyromonas sp. oral taxon 275]
MDKNYAAFYALLRQLEGITKEELVIQWTNGRTDSLRAMEVNEYNAMLRAMKSETTDEAARKKARSAALKQLQRYGVDTSDWDAVDRFCSSPKIAGKKFSHLTIGELQALRRKLLSMQNKASRKQERQQLCKLGEALTKGQAPS